MTEIHETATGTAEKTSVVGDCAKMHKALETLRELLEDLLRLEDAEYHNDFSNFCDIIDDALSAPPRNCDKYSHDQALRIWSAEPENPMNGCFDEWLYAPAAKQEGVSK